MQIPRFTLPLSKMFSSVSLVAKEMYQSCEQFRGGDIVDEKYTEQLSSLGLLYVKRQNLKGSDFSVSFPIYNLGAIKLSP